MTTVRFLADRQGLCGFAISGHSSFDGDDEEGRLVCAAVSSAAYMAANTITEVVGDKADITIDDAVMRVKVVCPSAATVTVLKGLRLHLQALSEQYDKHITFDGGVTDVKD